MQSIIAYGTCQRTRSRTKSCPSTSLCDFDFDYLLLLPLVGLLLSSFSMHYEALACWFLYKYAPIVCVCVFCLLFLALPLLPHFARRNLLLPPSPSPFQREWTQSVPRSVPSPLYLFLHPIVLSIVLIPVPFIFKFLKEGTWCCLEGLHCTFASLSDHPFFLTSFSLPSFPSRYVFT